jgi:hypothetical protein
MRTNITKVLKAWLAGKPAKGDSKNTCSTDGRVVFSYRMAIAWWDASGAVIVPYNAGPSRTTKSQIQACYARVARTDYAVTEASGASLSSWSLMNAPERPVEPAHVCTLEPAHYTDGTTGEFVECKCGGQAWQCKLDANGSYVCKCGRHWAHAFICHKCRRVEHPETFPEPDACAPGTDPFEFAASDTEAA